MNRFGHGKREFVVLCCDIEEVSFEETFVRSVLEEVYILLLVICLMRFTDLDVTYSQRFEAGGSDATPSSCAWDKSLGFEQSAAERVSCVWQSKAWLLRWWIHA